MINQIIIHKVVYAQAHFLKLNILTEENTKIKNSFEFSNQNIYINVMTLRPKNIMHHTIEINSKNALKN